MINEDSFNEDDEIFDMYSTKKVTATFQAQLKKIMSNKADVQLEKNIPCTTVKSTDIISVKEKADFVTESPLSIPIDVINVPSKGKEVETSRKELQSEIDSSYIENETNEIISISDNDLQSSDNDIDVIEDIPQRRVTRQSARLRKQNQIIRSSRKERGSRSKKSKSNNQQIKLSSNDGNLEVSLIEPDEDTIDENINYEVSVKVIWKSVGVKKFQLRRYQKFSKVYEHLMKEENITQDKIMLTLRGRNVEPSDTPESLDLQIYDFIDGGVLSESKETTKRVSPERNLMSGDNNSIALKFQDGSNKCVKLTLNRNEKIKVAMIKYAEQIEVPFEKIKFFFDGELLHSSETPITLDLDNDEVIDVKIDS